MLTFLLLILSWLYFITYNFTHSRIMATEPNTLSTPRVDAVSIKLPPFWNNLPIQWFCSIESQFNTRGIRQEQTKYDYVVQSLPQEIVASVYDVMQTILDNLDTPQANLTPYTTLKTALIDRHSLSESARLETLLGGIDIGDRKPSEFFRSLKSIAGSSDTLSDKLITNLWMRKLPTMVQVSLKSIPNPEINTLLSIADNIHDVFRQDRSNLCSIANVPSSSNREFSYLVERNKKLEQEIMEIKQMISNLNLTSSNFHQASNSRSRSQSRNRASNREQC